MNAPAESIDDYLLRWEELRRQGQHISPEELCSDPAILPRLQAEMEQLRHFDDLIGVSAPPGRLAGADAVELHSRLLDFNFLAEGGMGEVWVARDEALHRGVALKLIQSRHAGHGESVRRFLQEAEITSRLDHPGVPPVHARGTHVDGRPCYTMRYIHGETLWDAIQRFHGPPAEATHSQTLHSTAAGGTTPDSRPSAHQAATSEGPAQQRTHLDLTDSTRNLQFRKLLSHFVAVCQTIGYAHSRGIIHRDIKPQNIRLGKYGETVVLDWGLAKSIARDDDSEPDAEAALLPVSASGWETRLGDVRGTPAYMSPEQAAGQNEIIGPASDIYGLGATLYAVLAGKPPFERVAWPQMREAIQRGDYPPAHSLRPDVPKGLEALCRQAMAMNPQDRYPTALALASDVEQYLAGEAVSAYPEPLAVRIRRWMRKRRSVVAASIAAVVVAILSLSVGLVALAAKNEQLAEANARTTDLVDSWFSDISDSRELRETPNAQPVRQKLLRQAKDYYQKLLDRPAVDDRTRAEGGWTHFRLGRIADEIGSPQEAMESLAHSVEIFRQLSEENPTAKLYASHLATSENEFGNLLRRSGRVAEAKSAYEESAAIFEKLSGDDPTTTTFAIGLAHAYHNLGLLAMQARDLAASQRAYERARDIQDRFFRDHPDNTELENELALTHNNLGDVFRLKGNVAEAREQFRLAQVILERLHGESPAASWFASGLAMVYNNLGVLFQANGQLEEAIAEYRRARQIRAELSQQNPSVREFANDLAATDNNLGVLLKETGQLTEALQALKNARAAWAKLSQENPTAVEYASNQAKVSDNIGLILSCTGDIEGALDAHALARDILEELPIEDPASLDYRSRLGIYWHNSGSVLLDAGRHAEAREHFEKAIDSQRIAFTAAPDIAAHRQYLSGHYLGLAAVQRALGRPAEAIAATLERKQLWPQHADELFTCACELAVCVPLVGNDQVPRELTAEQQAERHKYADLALATLREAVAAGFDDAQKLRADSDLESIRDQPAFKEIIDTLMPRGE